MKGRWGDSLLGLEKEAGQLECGSGARDGSRKGAQDLIEKHGRVGT